MTLVLASGSETRAKMLRDAGVPIEVIPSSVDEDVLKAAFRTDGGSPSSLADALAEAKAREVADKKPNHLVLGSDQILVFESQVFDKPRDVAEARTQIQNLRGKTHELLSAAVLIRDGHVCWRGEGSAKLTMRNFSDEFLETYLNEEGDGVLWTVGGYQIEGRGAQFFEHIEDDYFSILGLPLMRVLAALRQEGVIMK